MCISTHPRNYRALSDRIIPWISISSGRIKVVMRECENIVTGRISLAGCWGASHYPSCSIAVISSQLPLTKPRAVRRKAGSLEWTHGITYSFSMSEGILSSTIIILTSFSSLSAWRKAMRLKCNKGNTADTMNYVQCGHSLSGDMYKRVPSSKTRNPVMYTVTRITAN